MFNVAQFIHFSGPVGGSTLLQLQNIRSNHQTSLLHPLASSLIFGLTRGTVILSGFSRSYNIRVFFSFLQGSSRSLQSVAQLLLWEVNALLSSSHLFSEWFLLLLSSLLSSLHEGELILLLFGRGQKKEIWHRLNMYYVSMTDINSL